MKDLCTHEVSYRTVVDFRKINEWLEYWSFSLLRIDKISSKLHDAKLFSSLDVSSGYYNIIGADDKGKCTTCRMEYGKYEFLKEFLLESMKLPSFFAVMINEILQGLTFCFAYLDNIIIYLDSEKRILKPPPISIWPHTQSKNLTKIDCDIFKSQIHYLGHLLSQKGISPLPEIEKHAVKSMATPQNDKELRQVLGLTGYYRNHINHAGLNDTLTWLEKVIP